MLRDIENRTLYWSSVVRTSIRSDQSVSPQSLPSLTRRSQTSLEEHSLPMHWETSVEAGSPSEARSSQTSSLTFSMNDCFSTQIRFHQPVGMAAGMLQDKLIFVLSSEP